jgi:hypothetical protein
MCTPTVPLHGIQKYEIFVKEEGYLGSLKQTTLASELNLRYEALFPISACMCVSSSRTPATELSILEDIGDPRCEHSALTGPDVPAQPWLVVDDLVFL